MESALLRKHFFILPLAIKNTIFITRIQ